MEEGEGEVAFFSAKRWDRRNRADLIESATPCHDAQVVGPYRDSNPLRLTVLAAMSEDYTTAPQHLKTETSTDHSGHARTSTGGRQAQTILGWIGTCFDRSGVDIIRLADDKTLYHAVTANVII